MAIKYKVYTAIRDIQKRLISASFTANVQTYSITMQAQRIQPAAGQTTVSRWRVWL